MSELIIDALVKFEAPNVFNPWQQNDPLDAAPNFEGSHNRCRRLWRHFNCIPHYLLVGEAPGYQGCHFSGVPFTNEALLCEGRIPRIDACERITTREKPWREPSATIVWGGLREHGIAQDVVMWNAFAFHPHKPGDPMSNRAPTKAELQAGRGILSMVLDYFKGAKLVAVGKVSEAALRALGYTPNACLRHPSMGGANEFRAGLARLTAPAQDTRG